MTTTDKPKAAFWIIAVIALIWNSMGVYAYLQQQYNTEAFQNEITPEQLEMVYATPSWAIAAFALAVFGGLLGALALLLRKKIANILFTISLLGILAQMTYNFFLSNSTEAYGPGDMIMPIMIVVIGIFLFMSSKSSINKGWLN